MKRGNFEANIQKSMKWDGAFITVYVRLAHEYKGSFYHAEIWGDGESGHIRSRDFKTGAEAQAWIYEIAKRLEAASAKEAALENELAALNIEI